MDNDNNKLNNDDDIKIVEDIDLDKIADDHLMRSEEESIPALSEVVHEDSVTEDDGKEFRADKKKKNGNAKKRNYWPLIITCITFCLSLIFSFISELATKDTGIITTNIIIAVVLLMLLIVTSIIFDGIGVSVTSCDMKPFNAMAARKVPHAKVAIMLVKNASKVNNICADVIGDICGIVSGACGASLVVSIMAIAKDANDFFVAILVSAFIAAFTVGGKAFEKTIAIKKSQQIVMMAARVIGTFYHPEKKSDKKGDKKRKNNARKDK